MSDSPTTGDPPSSTSGSTPTRQMVVAREFVVRRSELTCPGHSLKMEW